MADLICSLILFAFAILVTASYGVLAMLPKRAGNKRLDGHGGILLGRGIMEATYKLFEPLPWWQTFPPSAARSASQSLFAPRSWSSSCA
jgi:hypothetical protein